MLPAGAAALAHHDLHGFGPDNPHGLRLVVHRSGDAVYTDVTFDERRLSPGLYGGAVAAAVMTSGLHFARIAAAVPAP